MKAWTDIASKGNVTLFGYVITDDDGNVMSSNCYHSKTIEIGVAEDVAVALLLRDVVESGYTDKITIACDNKSTVERIQKKVEGRIRRRYKRFFNYIGEAMSYGGSEIISIPREENLAHDLCEMYRMQLDLNKIITQEVKIKDFDVKNLPNRVSFNCRKIRRYRQIGGINPQALNRQDRGHLIHEYRKLVKHEYMKDLNHLFVWASIQKCENTHDGRKKFIKAFVKHQHLKEELIVEEVAS